MNDEQQLEDTSVSPSETENTVVEQQNDSEVEKTPSQDGSEREIPPVPYERFYDINQKYQDLLTARNQLMTEKNSLAKQAENSSSTSDIDEALRIVDERIKAQVDGKIGEFQNRIELRETAEKHPDFYKFSDQIKEKISQNPSLGWEDAYKLVKFDFVGFEAAKAGEQQALKRVAEKKAANVETPAKTKVVLQGTEGIDPMAKGPDGKFLYSLKELESILPKK